MKASRVLMFRYLAAVVVIALLSAGGAVPVALGYYEEGAVEVATAEARRAAIQFLPDDGDGAPNSAWPSAMRSEVAAPDEDEGLPRALQAPWAVTAGVAGSDAQTGGSGAQPAQWLERALSSNVHAISPIQRISRMPVPF
jgi:hypothetical protein